MSSDVKDSVMQLRSVMVLLAGILLFPVGTLAADLTVISGGAVRTGLIPATAAFEEKTGHQIELVFNSTPQIKERIASGDSFDVLIAPPSAMSGFLADNKVSSLGATIGRVGAGIVARRGAAAPEITTSDQLKQALLDADSVVFNRSSSGLYIEKLIKEMGVWNEIKNKVTRYPRSDAVMQHLLKGGGNELGFGPMTRILAYKEKGLVLVGPLPPELQKLRAYNAAPMIAGDHRSLAEEFIAFLAGSEGNPFFVAAGID